MISTTPPGVARETAPERIQVALEKAKKSATAGERLYRSGVIANLDAENRVLKVVRLEAELECLVAGVSPAASPESGRHGRPYT